MNLQDFVLNVGTGVGIILGLLLFSVPIHATIMYIYYKITRKDKK